MLVRMRVQLTGSRNGAYWPAPGESIDLPDVEAAKMLAAGYATPAPVETATTPTSDVETATTVTRPRRRVKP